MCENATDSARAIVHELEKYDETLAQRERWLVINKIDLLTEADREARCKALVADLEWRGPVFRISAATGEGCDALCRQIAACLDEAAS